MAGTTTAGELDRRYSSETARATAWRQARDPRCAVMAVSDGDGLDVVIEGEAVRVTDEARLRRLAGAWVATHGEEWRFDVRDGAFAHAEGAARVFEVVPATTFAFGRDGDDYSQTRWRAGG